MQVLGGDRDFLKVIVGKVLQQVLEVQLGEALQSDECAPAKVNVFKTDPVGETLLPRGFNEFLKHYDHERITKARATCWSSPPRARYHQVPNASLNVTEVCMDC